MRGQNELLAQSKESEKTARPQDDSLEIALIGPGYGESVLIHFGDGLWMVVDSCHSLIERRSAPLLYLENLGVDPAVAVRAIVISHFDDDHIRGMAELVKACPNAEIVIANALIGSDFNRLIARINGDRTRKGKTGADEINWVLDYLAGSQRRPIYATQNREIYINEFSDFSHGVPIRIHTLSPSDAEMQNFLNWVGAEMPKSGQTYLRLPKRKRNDVSVVLWIEAGDCSVLLGADLEEEGRSDTGWSAVLASRPGRPWQKAEVYKVAHHGSETGHHDSIWEQMLAPQPLAILAPWCNGGKTIPSLSERATLTKRTAVAFSTATGRARRSPKRSPAVDRTIRENVKSLRTAEAAPGLVRLRKALAPPGGVWSVELFDGALRLKDWPLS